ncbi:MAG: protein kinase [candidate division Zixibacteria bacterium]|nr:protein kinase [candidate division Zixibacteria bacterium]
MPLEIGLKLGRYEILAPVGAGGMGEVYKAKDSRLDRIVAIKVLPPGVANNPDLRMRLEREAKAISSLNHPNICTLFDAGHENGIDYLVMEYIEGLTLSAKLQSGPMALPELLQIASQIADALDKAHRQGLVHRDLKPANIMLTKSGAKLLDFGLAKLQQEGVITGTSGITRTTPLTGEGAIVGTLQYMAPEQLETKETDARSDIFAFGAVVYEMATGKRAFSGKSQASLIAAIMDREPEPISIAAPLLPPGLDRLVRKCLQKDPDNRWQSARDMADELRWIAQSGSQAGVSAQVAGRRKFRFRLAWLVASVASIAAIALGVMHFTQVEPERIVRRFSIETSGSGVNMTWPQISPDGKMLAFTKSDSTGSQIWIRPMNSLEAYPLAGTADALRPFWSPDSKYLAYFTGSQLKKIPASGGMAQLICESNGADGCWGKSGVILFDANVGDSIYQVPASGGTATLATEFSKNRSELIHAWPFFLPDGKHFLYIAQVDTNILLGSNFMLCVGSLDRTLNKDLMKVSTRIEYSPAGYILHAQDGNIIAQPFDADKLELSGEPFPIAENVQTLNHMAHFSVSDNGTLVYKPVGSTDKNLLVWFDRTGQAIDTVGRPGPYTDISVSPDGKKVAYGLINAETQKRSIWVYDLLRDVPTRLTFGDVDDIWPIWSPDGTHIAYASNVNGKYEIFAKLANGLGEPKKLLTTKGNIGPSDWSADGKTIVASFNSSDWDIWLVSADGSGKYEELTSTPSNENKSKLSPNGRYIAYQSNESSNNDVYVRELGGSGGKWQISSGGGWVPMWRSDGEELFYRTPGQDVMAVAVDIKSQSFEPGLPKKLFRQDLGGIPDIMLQYRSAISPDGQKFLMNVSSTHSATQSIMVILDWDAEIGKK